MVTITPAGIRLALLEGAHAEESRTQERLDQQIIVKARELSALLRRKSQSRRVQKDIEAEMTQILDERKAA